MSNPENIEVTFGKGFDPKKHGGQLTSYILENYGEGYEITGINMVERKAYVTKRVTGFSEIKQSDAQPEALEIDLMEKYRKPSAGDEAAAKFQDMHRGYYLVKFDPYLGKATMKRMSESEVQCRDALAAVVGSKPWDVVVSKRRGGGFNFKLPKYTPSRHDSKLQEVAEAVVGRFGWYFKVDPNTRVGQIIPSEPPTFPNAVPFPEDCVKPVTKFDKSSDAERFTLKLAMGLGPSGEDNFMVEMNLDDSNALLLVGLPGSGKSVAVQSIVVQALIKGYRLAVINTPAKKTDYSWAKPYVHNNWWGCDDDGQSVAEALTVASLLDDEGKRMGSLLEQYGVGKWQDLPEDVKKANPPILVVADELANLLNKPNVPGGLPKDSRELPQFMEMAQNFLESRLLTTKLNALVAVHRAAGMREFYLTQRPSKTEGFPPELKSLIPHRVLLGPTPSEADVAMAFRDAKRVGRVPANIAVDSGASRGAGLAHLDGNEPAIIKGFYASSAQFEKLLAKYLGPGDPSNSRVRPTPAQIAKYVPRADGSESGDDVVDDDEQRSPSGRSAREIAEAMGDTVGLAKLDGMSANEQKHVVAGSQKTRSQREAEKEEARNAARSGNVNATQMEKCSSCGQGWLNPVTGTCTKCGQ